MSTLVDLDAASVRTADATLLQPLSWRVRTGEHWVVLGPNGAGKTTLLSILAARRHPSAGRVTLLGHELGRVDVRTLWPRIALVSTTVSERVPARARAVDVVRTGFTGALSPWWGPPRPGAEQPAYELLYRLQAGEGPAMRLVIKRTSAARSA